jgi:hypothetical protein
MRCGSCGSENLEGAKFCSECGTPCARLCPSCGQQLHPAAKFCAKCGTPSQARGTPVAATRPNGEFVKLCGARALFRHFFTLSVTKIVKFLGKIDSHSE